jgi:hypothetical protein
VRCHLTKRNNAIRHQLRRYREPAPDHNRIKARHNQRLVRRKRCPPMRQRAAEQKASTSPHEVTANIRQCESPMRWHNARDHGWPHELSCRSIRSQRPGWGLGAIPVRVVPPNARLLISIKKADHRNCVSLGGKWLVRFGGYGDHTELGSEVLSNCHNHEIEPSSPLDK